MSNKLIDLSALSEYKTRSDAKYQDKLTAGTGISIDANNVISSTGGGGGVTIPQSAAFNLQIPDFTSTFTLNNAFSTAVANQEFNNYKLGAKLTIGGTYPGTLYLAEADYAYDTDSNTSSHHIAALFVGSTTKTINVNTTNNSAIATAIKGQVGNSHFVGIIGWQANGSPGLFSNSQFNPVHMCAVSDIYHMQRWTPSSVQYNAYITKYHKLALFNNYLRTCKNVFESSGKYTVTAVLPSGQSSTQYYYMNGNQGTYFDTASNTQQCSVCCIVLLK